MPNARDKNLATLEQELRFIREQALRGGAEAPQLIDGAVESALQALFEYELSLQPASDPAEEMLYPDPPARGEGRPERRKVEAMPLAGSDLRGQKRVGPFVV